ncbi:MAG: hypothetical protein BRD30_02555 [Bacteroidetes bacterium QH_2_63_10]|nr:MAG: hypothetical protein BRD30_02555 [Bacteroidetes bacterium QH_2_63_10]
MADSFPSSSRLRQLGLCAVAVGLIALSTAGCVRLLEPRKSNATYYLLSSPSDLDTLSTDTTGLKVGLRQPRLASYLDATRIVRRHGPNTVQFSEFQQWGEDLSQGIGRTVAFALERQANIRSVEVVPWPKGVTFDYVLELHVLGFEGVGPPPPPPDADDAPVPEGHSRMVVQWTIRNPADNTLLARDLVRHQEKGWRVTDYQALVLRLSTSLDVLAQDIGARLRARP